MKNTVLDVQYYQLDDCYDYALDLHKTITVKGRTIMTSLKRIINGLAEKWISTDGIIHINHLIDGYNKMSRFFESMYSVSTSVVSEVVDAQQLRADTGGKSRIGNKVNDIYTHHEFESLADSGKYYFDPTAKVEYERLVQLAIDFDEFIHKVKDCSDQIMIRWKSGRGHQEAEKNFEEFVTLSIEIKKYLDDAVVELKTMLDNVNNNISKE